MDLHEVHGYYITLCEMAEFVAAELKTEKVTVTLHFDVNRRPPDPVQTEWAISALPNRSMSWDDLSQTAHWLASELRCRWERTGKEVVFYP